MAPAKLGQNFLVNHNVAEKVVKSFLPVSGEILEIGPGRGILTDLLIKSVPDKKIFAVELDKELSQQIRNRYDQNIEVINRSILDLILEEICSRGELNVIGNVPYYISREIMDWTIYQNKRINKCVFMMQKEFVDKIRPGNDPRKSGAQTIILNHIYKIEKLFEVSPGSFSPMPRVRSAVFSMIKREDQPIDTPLPEFYGFLKACYKNRRKTLLNNLSGTIDSESLWDAFEKTRINPRIRGEELSLPDFLAFFLALKKSPKH